MLNLYSPSPFSFWYVICIFSPCESYFLWLEKIFFLQCEQIILCSPYCAFKLVHPVYASNNKSLSSEIKMPARTKAETRRSSGEASSPFVPHPKLAQLPGHWSPAGYTLSSATVAFTALLLRSWTYSSSSYFSDLQGPHLWDSLPFSKSSF